MAGAVDSVIGSFKQSFGKRLLLYFTLITVLYGIGSFIVQALLLNLPLTVLLSGFFQRFAALQGASDAEMAAAMLGILADFLKNMPFFLAAGAVIVFIYTVGVTFLQSIFSGLQFNLARLVVEGKPYSLQAVWDNASGRFLVLFKSTLAITVLFSLFSLALAIPLAAGAINLLGSVGSASAESSAISVMQLFFGALIFALGHFLVLFLASPLLLFVAPAALFEKCGAIGAIKRSVALGARQYLSNLGFLLLLFLVAIIALAAAGIALAVVSLLLILVSSVFGILLALLLFYLFIFVFAIWANAFVSLAITRFYLSSVSPAASRAPKEPESEAIAVAPMPAIAPKPAKKNAAKRVRRK